MKHVSQAAWLGALSDPSRLAIVRTLLEPSRTVNDLTAACSVAMSNVNHHLKVLKAAGLATGERDGRWIYYSLVRPKVENGVLELVHSSGLKVSVPLDAADLTK